MIDINHLSYSSISSFLTCSMYWRFKYVDNIPTSTASALFLGSAFHATVEEYIRRGVTGGPRLIQDLWRANWTKCLEEEKNPIEWGTETPEELHNEGLRMLLDNQTTSMLDNIHPMIDATGIWIERKIELAVPGVPIPIIGYIDIITRDGIMGDFKTSGKSWTPDKAAAELQPLFYLAAVSQNKWFGVQIDKFTHYIFVKTKKPQVQVLESNHKFMEFFFLFNLIRNVWRGIEAGVFVENPGSWKCSVKFCEYWGRCRGKYL
jgi:putative RecB family exonuclease